MRGARVEKRIERLCGDMVSDVVSDVASDVAMEAEQRCVRVGLNVNARAFKDDVKGVPRKDDGA